MKAIDQNIKNSEIVLNKVEVVYDIINNWKGTVKKGQKEMINLRKLHDHFIVAVSKNAEAVANNEGLSFVGLNYKQSYKVAKKIRKSVFEREHINGGLSEMFDFIIKNYEMFNSPQDLLNWMVDNSPIVVRLKEEASKIHQYVKPSEIKHLIVA